MRIVLVVCTMLLALPCVAAEPAGVRELLSKPAVLRGEFEQSRHLHGFRNPLVSQGDFLLARDRGVVWMTRKPFASTTLITRDRLQTRQPDGSVQMAFDNNHSPAASMVNSLLLALISGDIDALSKYFKLTESSLPGGAWKLQLTPKKSALARIFAQIELTGDRFVRSVHLEEKSGDSTDLKFQALRDAPAQLDATEAKQFE